MQSSCIAPSFWSKLMIAVYLVKYSLESAKSSFAATDRKTGVWSFQ